MSDSKTKAYIGDSVYVDLNEVGQLVLTTENGYPDDPRNRIVLEPEVYYALTKYVERLGTPTGILAPDDDPNRGHAAGGEG